MGYIYAKLEKMACDYMILHGLNKDSFSSPNKIEHGQILII